MTEGAFQTGGAPLGDPGALREQAVDPTRVEKHPGGLGRMRWVIPGGCAPMGSTGGEPMFTSHEKLCLLNAGKRLANIRITVFFEREEPIGPFIFTIGGRRMRQVRMNDLIHPQAIPLDLPYAVLVESDEPIVAQFTRMDTRQRANASGGTIAWPTTG